LPLDLSARAMVASLTRLVQNDCMSADSRLFRRTPGVEEAPLQGELMLFDPATSRFFVLNRTMSFVWRRCDGAHTLQGMVGELASEFDGVDAGLAEQDLSSAIRELDALGLLAGQDVAVQAESSRR
jgi:coenzyme PQQ synthesis protein D (PqqD)